MANETQAGYLRDILLKNRLYWPSPIQFNDPFDCAPVPVLPESRIGRERYARALIQRTAGGMDKRERKRILHHMLRTNLAEIEATAPEIVRSRLAQIGVCSFSEIPDDI